MSLGKVIRKYRKVKNMTQEEMAVRLGVSAPAVNKWENENSCPDVMLLVPIARLLGISTDTLLSFREELTDEEISTIIWEVDAMLKEKPFGEVLQWAKAKLEEYPNCVQLVLQIANILDAWSIEQEIPVSEEYDEYICSLYIRVLDSSDEALRLQAADSLVNFYIRKRKYEKAETYLEYYSVQNPERKQKQAQIYGETGRILEAYKAYEELLFGDYRRVSEELGGMYRLAIENGDTERAHMLVDKQSEAARLFEMGAYYETSGKLEISIMEKDQDAVFEIVQEMLSSIEKLDSFRNAPLYEHMEFKEMRKELIGELKQNLLRSFRDEETFGFMKEDKRWQELTGE